MSSNFGYIPSSLKTIANSSGATDLDAGVTYMPPLGLKSVETVSTAGAGTITAAQVIGGGYPP